ncbi:hypothetical protein HDA35_003703 [Micromonospora purpureochromogenes]|uniref:Uncharacterized protein n=1 Tax=Micromonospora purpureochromogenes TaxID=47872 RepID=A0ABX2RMX9_9ACTN|nr:hypothetical protein [Micromonospora purpureochromogenes]
MGMPTLPKMPRALQWLGLIAMTSTFLGQVVSGFSRPINIVLACLSGGFALWIALVLWLERRSGSQQ